MTKSKLLLTLLLSYSVTGIAAENNIETQKQSILKSTNQRIESLQAFKSCVEESTKREAIKACRQANKKKTQEQRKAMKEKQQALKKTRKEKQETLKKANKENDQATKENN